MKHPNEKLTISDEKRREILNFLGVSERVIKMSSASTKGSIAARLVASYEREVIDAFLVSYEKPTISDEKRREMLNFLGVSERAVNMSSAKAKGYMAVRLMASYEREVIDAFFTSFIFKMDDYEPPLEFIAKYV